MRNFSFMDNLSSQELVSQPYKYGFVTDIEEDKMLKVSMKTSYDGSQQKGKNLSISLISVYVLISIGFRWLSLIGLNWAIHL